MDSNIITLDELVGAFNHAVEIAVQERDRDTQTRQLTHLDYMRAMVGVIEYVGIEHDVESPPTSRDTRHLGFGGDGARAEIVFPNGYGASIISGYGSYGDCLGTFELAVLRGADLCYDTPITDDVLGHLSATNVLETVLAISNLPAPSLPAQTNREQVDEICANILDLIH